MTCQVNSIRFPLHWLDPLGIPRQRALKGTGLTLNHQGAVATSPTAAQELKLFSNLIQLLNDPLLGLKVGESYQVATFGFYGYTLLHAPTMRDAINLCHRYMALCSPVFRHYLSLAPPCVTARMEPIQALGEQLRFYEERELAGVHRVFQQIYQQPLPLSKICFTHHQAQFIPAYQAYFGCPVDLSADALQLEVADAILDEPLPFADAELCSQFSAQCDQLLGQHKQHPSPLPQQIRDLLLTHSGFMPDADWTAGQLGISSRTLRRQLADAGVSFRQILKETRLALAKEYLRSSDMPIEQLAYLLGYSDPGSFSHAFRRWTGGSPQTYRHHHTSP